MTDAGPVPAEEMLRTAVDGVRAPDVVFAYSRDGQRTVVTGGTGEPPSVPREQLRYETGSASKTYTGLLLAELTHRGEIRPGDSVTGLLGLSPHPHRHRDAITPLHLATHTAGLPRMPRGFRRRALARRGTDPFAGYSREMLLDDFVRSRPRHAPGTRWRYSNFGAALLGHALAAATGTPFAALLARRVLEPLGLDATGLEPSGPSVDAAGHAKEHGPPLPPFEADGFAAAGAVRATPADLLGYLEAHLCAGEPGAAGAGPLDAAFADVREPLLRRGLDHRHTHTLTWFRHPSDHGPLYFHAGSTTGQQAFLGFRPDTGTALAALATRTYVPGAALTPAAYRVLMAAPPVTAAT